MRYVREVEDAAGNLEEVEVYCSADCFEERTGLEASGHAWPNPERTDYRQFCPTCGTCTVAALGEPAIDGWPEHDEWDETQEQLGDVLARVEEKILADADVLDPNDHSDNAERLRGTAVGIRQRHEADRKWAAAEAEREARIPAWRKEAALAAAVADPEARDPRIPGDAFRACSSCETGTMCPVSDEAVHCDEGDGSASVGTRCDNPACGVESWHSWPLTDSQYRDEFGHDFGELDEEPEEFESEDHEQQPLAVGLPDSGTSIGGSSLSIPTPTTVSTGAGETVDPTSAILFSDGVGQKGTQIAQMIETVIGNLTARGVNGAPIEHLQRMLEAAQHVTAESQAAKTYFEGHLAIQEVAQSDKTVGGAEYLNIHE